MGLFGRKKDDEQTGIAGLPVAGPALPESSAQVAPSGGPEVLPAAPPPPAGAAPADAVAALSKMFTGAGAFGGAQIIDARGVPGLRDEILGALKESGVDVAAMRGGMASYGVPGQIPAAAPAAAGGALTAADAETKLKRLQSLKEQGALTDTEYASLRQKILDEL